MKAERRLVIVFIIAMLGLSYVLYYNFHPNRIVTARSPLPSSSQVVVLYKTIAEHSGAQQAVVNIVKDGKYLLPSENITFDYQVQPTSFETLDSVMKSAQKKSKRNKGAQWLQSYVKVHLYGEELSKQMRVFLSLSLYPGFEDMKVVEPNFGNGILGSTGPTPFHDLYNLDQLNQIFADSGYPPIVSNKEYEDVCRNTKPIYIISFMPNFDSPSHIGYSKSVYEQLYKDKRERWVDCDQNKMSLLKINKNINITGRKLLCTTYLFNMSTLRQTVLKSAKCIEVATWGDHDVIGLNKNLGADILHADDIFHYLLNPSDMIMNEAQRFTEKFLKRPYVAIHIRANHINNLPTTVDRCFKLAMKIVEVLKAKRGVKSVYLSTDMTIYGGLGSFEPGHEEYLARIAGAVRYKPKTNGKLKEISRTSVSLTNVVLLSKSDHLIAMGHGSFHNFVMGRFLKEHFGVDPKLWSMIRMCENARGLYRKPTTVYTCPNDSQN